MRAIDKPNRNELNKETHTSSVVIYQNILNEWISLYHYISNGYAMFLILKFILHQSLRYDK